MIKKQTRIKLSIIPAFFALVFIFASDAQAEDHYVTQDGAGAENGSSLSNAFNVAQFNNSSYWNALSDTDDNKIGPGDTVYFSGIISSTLVPPGSGTASAYITLDGYATNDTTFMHLSEASGRALLNTNATSACGNVFDSRCKRSGISLHSVSYLKIVDFEATDCYPAFLYMEGSHHIIAQRNYGHEIRRNGFYVSYVTEPNYCYDISIGGSLGQGNVMKNIGQGTDGSDCVVCKAHDLVISHNNFYADNPNYGIDGITLTCGTNTYDILVEYNALHDHDDAVGELGEDGIDMKNDVHNVVLRFNKIYGHNNGSGTAGGLGVNLNNVNQFYAYGNWISDNRGAGFYSDQDQDDIYIFGNIIQKTDGSGITSSLGGTVTGWTVFNNVIAQNALVASTSPKSGVYLSSHDEYVFKNNIFYKNRPTKTDRRQFYVSVYADDNSTFDYNRYFWPSFTSMMFWGDSGDRNLSQLKAESVNGLPQELHGSEGDLGLIDPERGDFRVVSSGSAVYGKGTDMGSGNIASLNINGRTINVPWGFALGPNTDWSKTIPVIDEMNFDTLGRWDIGAYAYVGSTPTYILGDLNKDGKVDIADYSMFIQDFGKTGANLAADLNKNGQVEIGDYSIFISNFGKTS